MKIKYLVLGVLAYYSCFLFQQSWLRNDFAVYLLLGRFLAEGKGYFDYFLSTLHLNVRYPPGYPFLLSIVIRLFGNNLLYPRLLTLILMGISLYVLINLLGKYLSKKETFLCFILFSLSPYLLNFTHTVNSDVPYFLFSWFSILFFYDNRYYLSGRKMWPGALCAVLAFYMRGIGLSLYLSFLIYVIIKKKARQAILPLLFGLAIIPWAITVLTRPGSYGGVFLTKYEYCPAGGIVGFLDIPLRGLLNLKYYAGKVISDLVFFPYLNEVTFGNLLFAPKVILSLLFSFLFLYGFYLSLKDAGFLEIYVFVYFFLILFWPYHSQHLLLPLYPFLIGYLLIALRQVRIKFFKFALILGLLTVAVAAGFNNFKKLIDNNGSAEPCFAQGFSWIDGNTSQGSVIMSSDPAAVYFYTGRKGAFLELSRDPGESLAAIKERKVNYIFLEKEAYLVVHGKKIMDFDKFIKPLLAGYPDYFDLIYTSPDKCGLIVYKVNIPG